MALEFGYIYVINKTHPRSFIDNFLQIFTSSSNENFNEIIFEIGTNYQDKEFIDLTKYQINSEYNSLRLISKYNVHLPLYIDLGLLKTFYEIKPSAKPFHPDSSNIIFDSACTITYGKIDDIKFGIWKLNKSNDKFKKYLIGWDKTVIPKDLLMYLVHWIFVKN